jgi:hypothetical protein
VTNVNYFLRAGDSEDWESYSNRAGFGNEEKADQLGILDAITYLENARERLKSGEVAGFSDCKANCRSALVSFVSTLSGKPKIREGIRNLL